MHRFWNSPRWPKVSVLTPVLLALAAGLLLAACGGAKTGAGSASDARTLLKQTFSGAHAVNSGALSAQLSVDAQGSSILTQPVTLSFGGPFQSEGKGKLPKSDFSVAIRFDGHTAKIGIISTGTEGFVTLENTAYTLPAASFQQLESGVSAVGGGSSSTTSTLSKLGIHPEDWLTDPTVVGTAQVGGAATEHIHGKLALGPLLTDFSTIIHKASTVSATAASTLKSISPAELAEIKGAITNASFDLWTGSSDHTLRKLTVTATVAVTGSARAELGGMTSATISFSLGYSDIGQPQTINTPASSRPYSQFKTQISAAVHEIEELVLSDASGSSTTSTHSGLGSAAGAGDSTYSQCVTSAGGDVIKIQQCASLLNG